MSWKKLRPYLIAAAVGEAIALYVEYLSGERNPYFHVVLIILALGLAYDVKYFRRKYGKYFRRNQRP